MKLDKNFYPLPAYENDVVHSSSPPFPESLRNSEVDFSIESEAVAKFDAIQRIKVRNQEKNSSQYRDLAAISCTPASFNWNTTYAMPENSCSSRLEDAVSKKNNLTAVRQSEKESCAAGIRTCGENDLEQTSSFVQQNAGKYSMTAEKKGEGKQPINSTHSFALLQPTPVYIIPSDSVTPKGSSYNNSAINGTSRPSCPSTMGDSIKKPKASIKLEEFEACQSSPFDAVELKTLNVIEELRHILGHNNVNSNIDTVTQGHAVTDCTMQKQE